MLTDNGIQLEQHSLTVTVAKINGKQLTLSKIKSLPVLYDDNIKTNTFSWLEQYELGSSSVIGKIPNDIALTECIKRGYKSPFFTHTHHSAAVVIHHQFQLFLTFIPAETSDFLIFHNKQWELNSSFCFNWDDENGTGLANAREEQQLLFDRVDFLKRKILAEAKYLFL
ncbi:hypothetical protein HC723_14740 [Vibrio sp. S11_S32]|uniref:hypothetical protein n=1 Tax=Vibrio sp. S11_S32 TaxID=2720225 RepID=UPI0016804144|nr:hypothetical protein [Vibrio sp. S11_S32]MBD1577666.1 hypothetical protein [Vibrio sp. S11_S32]